jgi:hypothetical protein
VCGGQAQISADGYIENGPELVAEIAASTGALDLGLGFASSPA